MFIRKHIELPREAGVTLVELLVALALGLLLTTFLIQSYLSTKQTNRLTQSVGQVQENGRFATHFLAQHIRKAGNLGCVDYVRTKLNTERLVNFTAPITGWDYEGTGSDQTTYTLPNAEVETASNKFKSSTHNGISASAAIINNFRNKIKPIKGSDILIVNSVEPTDIILDLVATLATDTLTTAAPHGLQNNQIVMIGDCFVADLLQNASTDPSQIQDAQTSGGGQPVNTGNASDRGWSHRWGPDSKVYAVDSAVYYIGLGASGVPSLFRHYLNRGFNRSTPLELVEGVETFQVLYGEDTDATPDGLPNRYISADHVTDWRNVVSTRISLLLRSEQKFAQDASTGSGTFKLLGHLDVTPASDDRLLRYSFNTTLKPRNTGNVRTYQVQRARAAKEYQARTRL